MTTRFNAPWGRELTILTTIATALVGGIAVFIWTKGGRVTPALLLLIHAIPLALTVRRYELVPGALLIRRLWWDTRWPLDEPVTAAVRPDVMARSWRIWGNGGLFAISGHFSNAALGRYRAFVTDFKRTVVVHTPRGIVVVSPDRPDDFVSALERTRGQR
jgi:hypothetical protein